MSNETSVPHSPPASLDAWVKLLNGVRLPVPQASHDRVCRAIANNRSSVSYTHLTLPTNREV